MMIIAIIIEREKEIREKTIVITTTAQRRTEGELEFF